MNSFGTAYLQFGLFDPRGPRVNRQRFRRDVLPLLDRANGFYCPSGRWPARGWLLMARSEYNQIDPYSTTLQLNVGATGTPDNVATLGNLTVVQAQCVTRGLASDPNALYLVEVTDARGILFNRWFQTPTVTFYNTRPPAYPQTFYTGSMDGGVTAWTWATMLQDMWEQMTSLGPWPGLPSVPAGTPEGFWFTGVPAWESLCDVLEHLGMAVACDLTKANPYTIVNTGMVDAAFTALQTKYLTNLEEDAEWIDVGAGRVPAAVLVLFRRRNSVYGTEETVRSDAFQWSTTPFYTVLINAPAAFTGAVGAHYIWSDFTVRYDQDGNPLAADVTTANTIAQDRVTQYFASIYRQTAGFMSQTYTGALPFVTGSQVDGVAWTQDYSDQARQGWKTQIVRGIMPPWPELWDGWRL